MSPREQAQETFRKLQQQVQKAAFLRAAKQESNDFAKATLDVVYLVMDRLGWPDSEWRLESKSATSPGHFHSGPRSRSGLGVVVVAKLLGQSIEFTIWVEFADQHGSTHKLFINSNPLGGIQENNGAWTIADGLLDLVRNEVVRMALDVQEQTTAGA